MLLEERSRATDARQLRSRAALFAALDALLRERPYAEINVSDLAARAEVGRQTFYRHFDGIDAMLEERLSADLADQMALARQRLTASDLCQWLRELAEYAFARVAEQPATYRLILSGAAGSSPLARYREQIGAFLAMAPVEGSALDPATAGYTQSFYAGAVSAMLLQWLESEDRPPPAEMGRLFADLVLAAPNLASASSRR